MNYKTTEMQPVEVVIRPSDIYKGGSAKELEAFCERHGVEVVDFRPSRKEDLWIGAPTSGGFGYLEEHFGSGSPRFIVKKLSKASSVCVWE